MKDDDELDRFLAEEELIEREIAEHAERSERLLAELKAEADSVVLPDDVVDGFVAAIGLEVSRSGIDQFLRGMVALMREVAAGNMTTMDTAFLSALGVVWDDDSAS